MSTTKIVHGYRSKTYHEVMVTRADHNAHLFWINIIMKRMGCTSVKAEEYIKNNYDWVEIEYNEVT